MRIVMMGTGRFAEPTLEALLHSRHTVAALVVNPDRPSGREREMVRTIKKIALARNVPVFQPEKINTPEAIAGLQEFSPELLVVAAYGHILSPEVLAVAPHGGINIHASLLPKYRGAAPVAWAIYHGETRTGVTIIRMSPQMDAGDILAQEVVEIYPEETAGELEARLAQIGARLALQVIDQIEAGTVRAIPQDSTQATRAPKLKKEHGLIDWSRSAQQIVNHIRAMQPWPTAYTFWHRPFKPPLRLIIRKAKALEEATQAPPGTLVQVTTKEAQVACGQGVLRLVQVQLEGGKTLEIAEFLRGHPMAVGQRLGAETP
ncbi:MAG: methionyl-tRNA formyltransferase [Gemmatales bacterium]|nr:methionyl-tRNA formyltransferase [Gemmatales bacterium]MDW8223787.1 methionyl-tRNA formyltransferase [Gemmatales bacterium]